MHFLVHAYPYVRERNHGSQKKTETYDATAYHPVGNGLCEWYISSFIKKYLDFGDISHISLLFANVCMNSYLFKSKTILFLHRLLLTISIVSVTRCTKLPPPIVR